jgi:hypothetical protein
MGVDCAFCRAWVHASHFRRRRTPVRTGNRLVLISFRGRSADGPERRVGRGVYYGQSHVLHDLSLKVGEGELVCLLGRNGPARRLPSARSSARFGRAPGGSCSLVTPRKHYPRTARAPGDGLVPQGRRIFADLTVKENLQFAVKPGPWDLARVYRVSARLLERQRFRGDQLPAGEQPMSASGRAADEPAATPDGSALRRAGTACRRRDRGRDPPA